MINLYPFFDLTYLKDSDDQLLPFLKSINELPIKPAGICVYFRDMGIVNKRIDRAIKRVIPVNFPSGNAAWDAVAKEIEQAIEVEADEIDVVVPYQSYMQTQDEKAMRTFMGQCREAFSRGTLKFIIETGALTDHAIYDLTLIGAQSGADFIKTSTGKIAQGASVGASKIMMQALYDHYELTRQRVGLKLSGGIRSQEQIAVYLENLKSILGEAWLTPATFRVGTSQFF